MVIVYCAQMTGQKKKVIGNAKKQNVYDLVWNNENVEYREVFHQSEKEF